MTPNLTIAVNNIAVIKNCSLKCVTYINNFSDMSGLIKGKINMGSYCLLFFSKLVTVFYIT